jgi:hypothetical protein
MSEQTKPNWMGSAAMRQVENLGRRLGELPQVMAVAMAGSRAAGTSDGNSDFDLYVYSRDGVPTIARRAFLGPDAAVGDHFWEPGDAAIDPSTGALIEIMYRSPDWIHDQLNRVLLRHEASIGYSTCLWYNVLHSIPLFDRQEWYKQLQERARAPYPEELRHAIVAKNWPILRDIQAPYRGQIEVAMKRSDAVSVQHRTSALLASFFDLWFALERGPHPGEKRLLTHLSPPWRQRVRAVLSADSISLLPRIDDLLVALEKKLKEEGLLPLRGQGR